MRWPWRKRRRVIVHEIASWRDVQELLAAGYKIPDIEWLESVMKPRITKGKQ